MKRRLLCLMLAAAISYSPDTLPAQDNGLKTVDTKGTLEESFGFQLRIKDKSGQELNVLLDPTSSTLRYEGTADAKILSPGMMIRFSGAFDAKGNLQSDLTELELFRPKVGGRMMQDELISQTPGLYPLEEKKNTSENNKGPEAQDDSPAKPKKGTVTANTKDGKSSKSSSKQRQSNKSNDIKSGANSLGDVQDFKVVGRITNVQGNKLQINTGRQALIVQLAANAKIKVKMPDTEYAVKGDHVHVVGFSHTAQPDTVKAKIVSITGAKPLRPQQLEDSAISGGKKKDSKSDGKVGSARSK